MARKMQEVTRPKDKVVTIEIKLEIRQMTSIGKSPKPHKEYVRWVEINETEFTGLTVEQRQDLINGKAKEFLDDYVTVETKVY